MTIKERLRLIEWRLDRIEGNTTLNANSLADDLQTVISVLRELLDWARSNTSPRDANSPHQILIRATEVLNNLTGE
jgi:hypothetical protein